MKSMFNSQIGLVSRVMDMQLQRQNVITSNLANVETPNYKPRELAFEKELQSALGLDMKGRMSATSEGICRRPLIRTISALNGPSSSSRARSTARTASAWTRKWPSTLRISCNTPRLPRS